MQPLVSIVLPFYNCENRLADSIESILSQTFKQFELILVNNNSNDNSHNIASRFVANDSRIKLIEEPRQGSVFALNSGIELAQAPYIARMDANDTCSPERLEKQVGFLNNNPVFGIVSCQVEFNTNSLNTENQEAIRQYILSNNKLITSEQIWENCFIESPIIDSTVMFRKELVDDFGGYITGDFPSDYELWLRWLSHGVKMQKLHEILYQWTYLPDRLSQKNDRYTDQAFFEVKSRYLVDWLKKYNQFYPDVAVWGAGRQSRQRFYILHELGIQAKFYIDLRENPANKVIQSQHTPPAGRYFILSYVSNRFAREKIKIFLVELGYTEGKDFLCVS
jgi:glycosyltransferase involved in cell wall biosynthesis